MSLRAPPFPGRRSVGAGTALAVSVAGFAALVSLAAIACGIAGIVIDRTQRDASGYVMTSPARSATSTYAIVSASYRGGASGDLLIPSELLGTIRVRVASAEPVFAGIGPVGAVDRYMAGVAHAGAGSLTGESIVTSVGGGAPASPPAAQRFWVATSAGAGTRTIDWAPRPSGWRIVVMNADASPGVSARVSVGARLPHLLTFSLAALGAGLVVILASAAGLRLTLGRMRRPG